MFRRIMLLLAACLLVLRVVHPALSQEAQAPAKPGVKRRAKPIDFAHEVVPILKKRCVECHGGTESKGGFSLNTRALLLDAEAAVPGKADASRLIELILSQDPKEQMPPKDRPRLPASEIDVLQRWIGEGLPWEAGFSFARATYEPPLRPRRPQLPPVRNGRDNPIDRIIDAHLAQAKTKPPLPLDDVGFVRRVYLDLTGLPPTIEQLDGVTSGADGQSTPDVRRRLVRQLLDDRQVFAEHWLTLWSDLLRNAYSGTGYIDGGRKQITGWLYQSLLENKPYDQFVRELIAPTAEAEGFIRGIKWRGNVNASQTREVQFAQNISQVFLGINMKCASCHDSFIDRWTLNEAYGLAAIYSTRPLEIYRCDKPTGKQAAAAWIFPELGQVDSDAPQPERLKQLAELMTHPENGRLARTVVNRIWRQLMGRGIVHPVDAMHTRPWSADLLDYLAVYLVEHKYDLKAVIELIVTSQAYQSQSVVDQEPPGADYVFRGPILKRMTAEQYLDTVWSITDTWPKPDARALKRDGRQQGGQLLAVLAVHKQQQWKDRPVRAVFTPLGPLQASLGRPNREQVVTDRPDLFTTLEALQLSNGPTLADTLRRGAVNVLGRHGSKPDALIDWLYRRSLARPPNETERNIARRLLGETPTQQSVEDLLWAVFMLPEFQYVQ